MHGIMPMAVVFIHGEALREILIELSVGSGRKVSMGNSPYESHLNDSVMKSKLADPIPLRLVDNSPLLIQSASPVTMIRCSFSPTFLVQMAQENQPR